MREQTNRRIKVLTNSGFKYEGDFIEENPTFIILIDDKQGKIKIPLVNVSLIKEVIG